MVVDAAGYRARRAATLETVARRAAEQAAATGRRVELEPMTAVERRIVHELLKDDPEVETSSEGTEPDAVRRRPSAPIRGLSGRVQRPVLDRWLAAVTSTPGLTAIRDPATARAVLLDDALRAADLVAAHGGPDRRRRLGRRHARDPARRRASRPRT